MSYKICFVCTGNACRSPFAECVTKTLLADAGMNGIEVFSLGTLDWGENPRDVAMVDVAKELGYDLSGTTTVMTREKLMTADAVIVFAKVIVGHPHTYHLRKHGGNIVAVWCNADQFARAEGLHGLFTGMIVSELSEALLYQVETTQEELDRENVKLARRLRSLLDARIPLSEIPKRILAMDDVHSPLTTFNYRNFHYL